MQRVMNYCDVCSKELGEGRVQLGFGDMLTIMEKARDPDNPRRVKLLGLLMCESCSNLIRSRIDEQIEFIRAEPDDDAVPF